MFRFADRDTDRVRSSCIVLHRPTARMPRPKRAHRLSVGLTLGLRLRIRRRFRRRLAFRDTNAARLHPCVEIVGAHPAAVLIHVEAIVFRDGRGLRRRRRGELSGWRTRGASGEREDAAARGDGEHGTHSRTPIRSYGWIPRAECRRGHRARVRAGRDIAHKTDDPLRRIHARSSAINAIQTLGRRLRRRERAHRFGIEPPPTPFR